MSQNPAKLLEACSVSDTLSSVQVRETLAAKHSTGAGLQQAVLTWLTCTWPTILACWKSSSEADGLLGLKSYRQPGSPTCAT